MFKEDFKYYKSKRIPPDLSKVLDFYNISKFKSQVIKLEISPQQNAEKSFLLKPIEEWEVFELVDNPGLIFIKNPFTELAQRYWPVQCLHNYSKKPNISNLTSLKLLPEDADWWEYCQSKDKSLLKKMRWVTLGFHHDWDSKHYSDYSKAEFPDDLAKLTSFIVKCFGYSNFSSEAAIINFYHMDSTLSGHTDHSEVDLEAPLVSYSFGQTAIFLLGGTTIEQKPTAMFLRHGDIVIMSKASRLCYHGVPKILKSDIDWKKVHNLEQDLENPNLNKDSISICLDNRDWEPFREYLSNSRININVRQVLRRGQKRLNENDV